MSNYFPFGGADAIVIQNISYALTATTASLPSSPSVSALTASFASSVKNTPPNGTSGTSVTEAQCNAAAVANPGLLTSGSSGGSGGRGPKGSNVVSCPPGTIECTGLNQFLTNLNNTKNRPSGSQFVKVCMEIPPGCTAATAVCPPYLPSASVTSTYPSIP